jgi:hypothetical protein
MWTIGEMPLSLKSDPQLAASLAAVLLHDVKAEITADSIDAVLTAASIKVPAYIPTIFATYIEKAGGIEKFLAGPSAGGGGGGAGTII